MKILGISVWYNEKSLAHFFLRHYSYLDKILILLDSDTNDDTRNIIKQYHNAEIIEFTFPEHKVDEDIKADHILNAYKMYGNGYDWIYNIDADELIMPPNCEHPYSFLERNSKYDIINADIFQMYKHHTEKELDYNKEPIVYQRRHGTRNFFIDGNYKDTLYIKPIIVRPGLNIQWCPGNHSLISNNLVSVCPEMFIGGHWAMAEKEIAITRRIFGRKNRQSLNNLQKGYNIHQMDITEDSIIQDCDINSNLPEVF